MTSWTAINIVVEGQLAMKRGSPDPFMHVHGVLHGPDELMMDRAVAKHEEATNRRSSMNDSTYIHIEYNGIPVVHCLGAVPPKGCNVQQCCLAHQQGVTDWHRPRRH
jgi:hypothetical protein